jgi:very-short-patch-repair endonuclease
MAIHCKKLQTNNEEALYKRLKEALPEYHIFAQVQLSRFIDVKKGHDFNQWFNRINRMSVDFVVCDESLKVLAVIELDDSSHRDPHRQKQDDKKNKALKSAGIKIIRWQKTPSKEEIISQIKSDKNTPLAA